MQVLNCGKSIRMQLYFDAKWILLSEVKLVARDYVPLSNPVVLEKEETSKEEQEEEQDGGRADEIFDITAGLKFLIHQAYPQSWLIIIFTHSSVQFSHMLSIRSHFSKFGKTKPFSCENSDCY